MRGAAITVCGATRDDEHGFSVVSLDLAQDAVDHVKIRQDEQHALNPVLGHGVHCLGVPRVKEGVEALGRRVVIACEPVHVL
jgi:hypothetical protein